MVTSFDSLNSFFDHIYVITLQRATQRHENIKKDLAGLNYSFFFGADKNDFSIDQLKQDGIYDEVKAIRHHRYNKPMSAGQIGCSWSHKLVHMDMLQKGYEKILVLEDDVTAISEGLNEFDHIIQELPPDWELLYLDYAKNEKEHAGASLKKITYHLQHLAGALKWSHQTIANLYAKPYSAHLKHAGFHDYTDAYAITASAAKKLAGLQTPLSFVADNLLAYACTNRIVNGFISIPKVFSQESQSNKDSGSFVED